MFIGDHGAFIELVRSRPILYDSSNPDYRDADKKKSSWLEVISEWDSVSGEKNSLESITKKWGNLRDIFSSNKRAFERKIAVSDRPVKEPTWKYYRQMSWYVSYMKKKDHVKLRAIRPKPTEVLVSTNSVGNELKFSLPTSSTCSTVSPTSVSTMASESTDPIVSTAPIAKPTRSMPSMVTRVTPKTNSNITSKERKSELLNRLIGLRKNEENHDEAYHWGMSLAARYRKLTSYQQAVTRREIEKVFFQAQFNTPREFTPDKPSESTFADSEDVKMESSESDESEDLDEPAQLWG